MGSGSEFCDSFAAEVETLLLVPPTGPWCLPLALRLSEGLGVGFPATCMRVIARPVVAKVQPCCLPDP